MIYNNTLKVVKDPKLTSDQKIEVLAENLASVTTEIELHQSELYFVKKGIIAKSNDYYKKAQPKIQKDLVRAYREMEWAFVVNDITSFCNAVYRQLEIFSNYILFEHLRFDDNIIDSKGSFSAGPNHYFNKLNGCFVYDQAVKTEKFINFSITTDKAQHIDKYYLKTDTKTDKGKEVGYLKIAFSNKMNLLYGFYINSEIVNPADSLKYKYFYNQSHRLTKALKDIRDAREHGLQSNYYKQWEAKHYLDSLKLVHELYYGIKDLRV